MEYLKTKKPPAPTRVELNTGGIFIDSKLTPEFQVSERSSQADIQP
jgi:hypothetical protein